MSLLAKICYKLPLGSEIDLSTKKSPGVFVPLGTFEVVDVSGVVNVSAKPEIEMVQVAIRTLGETGDGSPIYFSEAIGTDYTATGPPAKIEAIRPPIGANLKR